MSEQRLPTLGELIKACVERRLKNNRGNQTKTARELGISVRTLRYWVKENAWPYKHVQRDCPCTDPPRPIGQKA